MVDEAILSLRSRVDREKLLDLDDRVMYINDKNVDALDLPPL